MKLSFLQNNEFLIRTPTGRYFNHPHSVDGKKRRQRLRGLPKLTWTASGAIWIQTRQALTPRPSLAMTDRTAYTQKKARRACLKMPR